MKISIKTKLFLFYHFLFYKHSDKTPFIKIGSKGKGIKNILFLLPYQRKIAQIVAHLIKKNTSKKNYKIKYIVHEQGLFYYDHIPENQIITYDNDDLNYFGLIKRDQFMNKLKDDSFGALVDLTNTHDQTLSVFSLKLSIPIKLGFDSPISHKLYTVIIKPDADSFVEEHYTNIEKILGLTE